VGEQIETRLRRLLPRIALSWLAPALLAGIFPASAGAAGAVVAPRGGPVVSAAAANPPAPRGTVAQAAGASSGGVALPANASSTGLALALDAAGGHQYVFWRGSDGRIYEATYTRSWRGPLKTPWFSGSTPSAAVGLHGVLYLAWQGAEGHIFEASYDGKWHTPKDLTKANRWRLKGTATSAVSLAVNPRNGAQFLMWRGTEGRIHEAWRGAKWHRPLVMPWALNGAPTVAVTRAGHQYVFWADPGGDIEEAWHRGSWRGPLDLTRTYGWGEFGQTTTRPGIAVNPVDESQYVFWAALDGRLYEAWYSHGWHGPLNMGWSTGSAPALAVTPASHQYVFWQGPDGGTWESWYSHRWRGPIAPLWRNKAAGPEVEVTQTTANFSERLARLRSVSFTGPPHAGLPLITVDESQRYQRFTGVGGAMTDSSAWLIYDELSAPTRIALMNDLFGRAGAHHSFTLVPMGGSDFTQTGQPYTYDDVPAGQSDPQLAQFSIGHDEAYILPALREMLAVNRHTTVMATPWTAPPWMKANGAYDDLSGTGTLTPSALQPFADYFVRFLQAYAAHGVPIAAIAPENEPDSGAPFPAMKFPAATEAQWITQNLEPSLQAANLHPRLYGGDVGWAGVPYPSALLSSQAAGALAGIAWHCYGGFPTVMTDGHAQAPGGDQIVTECSLGIEPYPAPEVLIGSLRNWASVVTLWNLALDPAGGPVQPPNYGCPHCTGEVTINESTQTVNFRLSYFQLGQVSAFVQPGATHIGSNSFVSYYQTSPSKYGASPGLDDVAFVNPDGTRVLIAYNNSTSPIRFGVAWHGRGFAYSLPANATVTFRWKP
jgi:glucosylceramidase